jgi:hypothetical protein
VKLTEASALAEDRIGNYLRDTRGWTSWRLDTGRRPGKTPTFLAVHRPTAILISVYVRTRSPLSSEWPPTQDLPETVTACVWHPAIGPEIRKWLANPSGPPPGARGDTTPEHSVWMEPLMAGQAPRTGMEARAMRAAKAEGWTPTPDTQRPPRSTRVRPRARGTTTS